MNLVISRSLHLMLVAVAIFGAGCGKSQPKPATAKPAGQPANVDISALPAFLRYPGAKATERVNLATEDMKGSVWTLESGDQGTAITDWYRASVEKQGWIKSPKPTPGMSSMLEYEKPDGSELIKLMTYAQNGKTMISLAHRLK